MHIFPFSPRRGTPAYDFPDHISAAKMKSRKNEIAQLNRDLMLAYHKSFIGEKAKVLIERQAPSYPKHLSGHTKRYVETIFPENEGVNINSEVDIIIEKADEQNLHGIMAKD